MNSTDIIKYTQTGFNGDNYIDLQRKKILERMSRFHKGRLYLEIGGKFLEDPHAARVLPGYKIDSKVQIFKGLIDQAEIIFCVEVSDLKNNRQLKNTDESYADVTVKMILEIQKQFGISPYISINLIKDKNDKVIKQFIDVLRKYNLKLFKRYFIEGYPQNSDLILSEQGYGADEYIPVRKSLVLVTGAASNSGKMSTCLGQIYQDHTKNVESGYAKFETFPVWNLPLEHPVNLAYEAATADIGDFNVQDLIHEKEYGQPAVNYNRDKNAFAIVNAITQKFITPTNYMRQYKSPTDMGISNAGFAITDDRLVCKASLEEIRRRAGWYKEMLERGSGKINWINRCRELELRALDYIREKNYI